MSQRYTRYDIHALARLAAAAIGLKSCVTIEKYPDSMFNKALLLTMEDSKQVVAKIPNPNAGPCHFTIASEVATMDFVLKHVLINRIMNLTLYRCATFWVLLSPKSMPGVPAQTKAPSVASTSSWNESKASHCAKSGLRWIPKTVGLLSKRFQAIKKHGLRFHLISLGVCITLMILMAIINAFHMSILMGLE